MRVGTKVQFRDHPFGVRLRSMTGVVQSRRAGWVMVTLDEPALVLDTGEELSVIREADVNLEVLDGNTG